MSPSADEQLHLLTRDAAEVAPREELAAKLAAGQSLRVKLGLDPTAGHVHLGWAVVLRKLRQFQDLGHTAVLIVGDFTARIGDPSLQDKTRPMLSREEVDAHASAVLEQFRLILAPERLEVRHNSEWLEDLGVHGFLELASHQTVAQLLQRDDFAERYATGQPLSLREFVYPMLQGYDSIAVEADVEIGGTDQHFNLLVGRHLQRACGQDPQTVLTMPLLEGTDGVQKMSQSLGNYIAITEAPDEIFGKLMRVPDALMGKFFRLTTSVPIEEIEQIESGIDGGEVRPEAAKRRLAHAVVELYHGRTAADAALERFDTVFKRHEVPSDVPEFAIPADCVVDGCVDLPRLLKAIGLVSSTSDGKRQIAQRGVHVDDETLTDERVAVERVAGRVLRVGRRRFARLSAT